MNVKQLIEQLQRLSPDLTVLIAGDQEGNYYRKFSGDMSSGHSENPDERNIEWSSEEDWKENEYEPPYPGDNIVVLWPRGGPNAQPGSRRSEAAGEQADRRR